MEQKAGWVDIWDDPEWKRIREHMDSVGIFHSDERARELMAEADQRRADAEQAKAEAEEAKRLAEAAAVPE